MKLFYFLMKKLFLQCKLQKVLIQEKEYFQEDLDENHFAIGKVNS